MKRAFDIIFSLILFIVLSPLMVLIGILIRIDSSGGALFRQKRVGQDGQLFTIYKFRTMKIDAPQTATNSLKQRDQYITRTGRFLRLTSLDELPQLYNIIRGEMSFVGPRPVIAEEEDLVARRKEKGVYDLRPGVTGWAQINGRDTITPAKKVELDLYYIENKSLLLDLKILFLTGIRVLRRDGVLESRSESKSRAEREVAAGHDEGPGGGIK